MVDSTYGILRCAIYRASNMGFVYDYFDNDILGLVSEKHIGGQYEED